MSNEESHGLLGAYILGGLTGSEREAFEHHLKGCPGCRAEVGDAAGLPELLDLVPLGEALRIAEPQSVEVPTDLIRKISRHRRRNSWLVAAGVAAALVLGILVSPFLSPAPPADASYSVQSSQGVRMDVDLNSKAWGTELSFTGTRLPNTGQLSLWVVDDHGTVDPAGRWMATPNGKSRITGAVPTPLTDITAVQLRDARGTILADVSMDGDH